MGLSLPPSADPNARVPAGSPTPATDMSWQVYWDVWSLLKPVDSEQYGAFRLFQWTAGGIG